MRTRAQALLHLFQARLSRRIVLWVFASIVVIEAIILIPSVYRRERELLDYLEKLSTAEASGILSQSEPALSGVELLERLQQLEQMPNVKGGALYEADGDLVGSFREPPQLSIQDIVQNGRTDYLNRADRRYDAVWEMSPLDGRYILVVRHDASGVRREVYLFIARIAGLVLIISLFVTMATLIVLEPMLITPILLLRQDLLRAGQAARQNHPTPEFSSLRFRRQDELGDMIAAFEQMYQQVTDAIAERDRAEASLRASEEKFSKAFRSSPNPIIISTLEAGKIIEVNQSFLALYGAEREDVIGQMSWALNLWVNHQDRIEMVRQVQAEGMVFNQEYQFCDRNHQLHTVLFSAERITINQQDCILSVVNDITERKQMEEALRGSEMRFRALVEQAADAFFVVTQAGKIADVNQQACQNLGYSREELLQMLVTDVQQEITMAEFEQLWQQLQPGIPITLTGTHRRRDGSVFPVEVRAGRFAACGESFILALARDITERKQTEQALERLAEIGELAAMIVHEVRNPLTTVWMGLNSFKSLDLSPRFQARLELALEESERLQRLLNEILLYAKQQQLEYQRLELNQFLEEILVPLREMPAAVERLIQLTPSDQPAWVECDRDKLHQVFINIISNACEAVSPQTCVTCTVSLNTAKQQIHVDVFNAGEPIPAETLAQLTKPFFTTKSSGNGLGLAITKRIIEAHNGMLTIQSSDALGGTQVTVLLPLKPNF
ncbi:MAG: PAS domain S-box protein [Thainema sp.]